MREGKRGGKGEVSLSSLCLLGVRVVFLDTQRMAQALTLLCTTGLECSLNLML